MVSKWIGTSLGKWVVYCCDDDERCGTHYAVKKENAHVNADCPHCGDSGTQTGEMGEMKMIKWEDE